MNSERCIACGEIIPEGRQICLNCESNPKRSHCRKGWTREHVGCHSNCPDWTEKAAERNKNNSIYKCDPNGKILVEM